MFANPRARCVAVALAPSHADAHLPDRGGESPPSCIRPGTPPQRAKPPCRRLGGLILGRLRLAPLCCYTVLMERIFLWNAPISRYTTFGWPIARLARSSRPRSLITQQSR
jgi:hypothetical protein